MMQTVLATKIVADDAAASESDPVVLRDTMGRLSRYLNRATEEGRAAIDSLRALAVETDDLEEGLGPVVAECHADGVPEVHFETVGNVRRMHPSVRDEVFKIASEGIRNACSHAQASRLHVQIDYRRQLLVKIEDNGLGIDPSILKDGRKGHFGLSGMRERARNISGSLDVTSSPIGTRLSLSVPAQVAFRQPGFLGTLLGMFSRRIPPD
jgi:signal transduction histidine kinase